MILKSFSVRNFQSITDSNAIGVGEITCLVGKNEAGKTALLKALYRLNPITKADDKFDVTEDYPRSRVSEYEQEVNSGKKKPDIVTTAMFALEPAELKNIEDDFGAGVLPYASVTLERGYDNTTYFYLNVNEVVAGNALLARAKLAGPFSAEGLRWTTLSELKAALNARVSSHQQQFALASAAAEGLPDPDEKRNALAAAESLKEPSAVTSLRALLDKITEKGVERYFYETYLDSQIPQFLYFDEYYQMRGCENIDALQRRIADKQLQPSDHPLIGLIELAGLKLEELLSSGRTQDLKNKLQGAGNLLTRKILKYWSQNRHLRLAFDVRPARPGDPDGMSTGTNIWAEVMDQRHFVNTALGSRSRGFVWFFSLLSWYSRVKATMTKRVILLLDEPGLSLHAKAQKDLLRYFEDELKSTHQLLYSTHSPFMIDPAHYERVRVVQDKTIDSSDDDLPLEQEGTKVVQDILDAGPDSLFPLQGALGFELYQTLFIGPNNVIVGGTSDLLYLQALSAILSAEGHTGLDSKWTITPVGGADMVPIFIALIGAQNSQRVATLINFQKTHAQMIQNLYKRKLLSKNQVFMYADFTGKSESDLEDLFELDFYLHLVNEEYKGQLASPISPMDLTSNSPRCLVAIEQFLARNPLKSGTFTNYRPARYFGENASRLSKNLSPATLHKFEAAFKALNALLK